MEKGVCVKCGVDGFHKRKDQGWVGNYWNEYTCQNCGNTISHYKDSPYYVGG
jgi:hypothetical protein